MEGCAAWAAALSLLREHFWVTTQPVEEPPEPAQFQWLLQNMGMDHRLMFATDYPHWDFDAPDSAIAIHLEPEREAALMAGNASRLYGLPLEG